MAEQPEAKAKAIPPPSNSAKQCSKVFLVGVETLEYSYSAGCPGSLTAKVVAVTIGVTTAPVWRSGF